MASKHKPYLRTSLFAAVFLFFLLHVASATTVSAQTGPQLVIAPDPVLICPSDPPVVIPIEYTSNGHDIAATTFSVDFDENCLSFDETDGDGDGIPDAVTFNVPPAFGFAVTVDLADTDGELDFFIADTFPPLATLPDGVLVTIEFGVNCQPPLDQPIFIHVSFSDDPAATFGDTGGASVPGETVDLWVEINWLPGDCNGDCVVDAGDLPACVLEIFDGDGNLPQDAPGGTFPGTPPCDANQDGKIDAADIICTVLIIFNGPGSCAGPVSAASDLAAAELSMADGLTASADGQVAVPVVLSSNGHALSGRPSP